MSSFTGLTSDSRHVAPGMLFAALPGTKLDGRQFITDAITKGAAAILVPAGTPKPATQVEWIESENPRRDFSRLVAAHYKTQPETVAAVTGTNGKTSTVHYTQQFWQQLGYQSVSIGTVGIAGAITREGSMTTPDPVTLHQTLSDLNTQGITHAAMEASSHGLDQYRLDGVRITVAAFTNLTRDHLDYHGTMDRYFEAKARLFTEILKSDGTAVVNIDDAYGQKLAAILQAKGTRVFSTGIQGQDLKLIERIPVPEGQNVKLSIFGTEYQLSFPVVGSVQIFNVLTALGIVLADQSLNASQRNDVIQSVARLHAPAGRVQSVPGHQMGAGVYVDYAHTPDALEHLLQDLRPHTQGKLICVFGCGGDRDTGKRPQMGALAERYADIAIVTDDNPRSEDPALIRAAILKACPKGIEIGDRAQAITRAIQMAGRGDVVVIAGKGHEQGQTIQGKTYPFDDVQEARRAMSIAQEKHG